MRYLSSTVRFEIFQQVRQALVERFDEVVLPSDSTVQQELARLAADTYSDQETVRSLMWLASARDSLLSDVRRSVSPDRFKGYLDSIVADSRKVRSNADLLGARLQVDLDWSFPP